MGKLLRFLVLACLAQVAGAQGLFKGFVPDENGTNLDAQQASKKVQQKVALGTLIKDCAECPEMVVVPSGDFKMGSSALEQALANAAGVRAEFTALESPQHDVRVQSFAAGRYAVTKVEFAAFVRFSGYRTEAEQGDGCWMWAGKEWKNGAAYNWRNVGFTQGDDHPVVCVTWNDAQAYIQWLNRISGESYRLLSEAEREYAARGGTQTAFWWGDSVTTSQANYDGNYSYNGSPTGRFRQATSPVNSFSANLFGLYNVHGNVWEWTQDCWHETYDGAPKDGSAWTTGCSSYSRVIRGGSWYGNPANLRSAFRSDRFPELRYNFIGFRLARDL
jgi:formylglycine-generating enzyme required for sulfatase activity